MSIIRLLIFVCGIALIAGCAESDGVSSGSANNASSGPCGANPSPGDTCDSGAIYLGELTPGAISGGSQTDHYMTTPGGCTNSATPTCSGTDSLTKAWYGSGGSNADIAGLVNFTTTNGPGHGSINKDQNYGDANTAVIVADASIGSNSAAAYCNDLVYAGYSDWYLPNRYELNLFDTNKASIPGLKTGSGDYYWSSTEFDSSTAWVNKFFDDSQVNDLKFDALFVRCVRRY